MTTGGWYSLIDILHEGVDRRRAELDRPPLACQDCGEPLKSGPNGENYCPWDGSVWEAGNRKVGYLNTGGTTT